MASITYDYTSSTGFSFTANTLEFSTTGVQAYPSSITGSELFVATFDFTYTADRSVGTVGSVVSGGASISAGNLVFPATTTAFLDHSDTSDVMSGKTGSWSAYITPEWAGTAPSTNQILVDFHGSNHANRLFFYYTTDKRLAFQVFDTTGALQTVQQPVLTNYLTSGSEYHIQLDVDFSNGVNYIWLNGQMQGGTLPGAPARGTAGLSTSRLGNYSALESLTTAPNYKMRDARWYSTVQDTASFSADLPRSVVKFAQTDPFILVTNGQGMSAINSLTSSETATGSDIITYSIKANGSEYYVAGGTIATSDASYTQSSSLADWQTRLAISPWDIDPDARVQMRAFLHSDNGVTTPHLISVTAEYDFFAARDSITTTELYGYVTENVGGKFPAKIEVTHQGTNFSSNNSVFTTRAISAATSGYWVTQVPLNVNYDVKESFIDANGDPQVRKHEINSGSQTSISLMSAAGLYTGS